MDMILPRDPEPLTPEEEFESRKRGKSRELKFLHAWRISLHKHLWLRSVRGANRKEDFDGHIDAFLMLADDGREIPVQIKGNYESARVFREKWNAKERGIAVVVVGDDYSTDEILLSTTWALEMAERYLRLPYHLIHELKVCRFLETWRTMTESPDWFQSVREATGDERVTYGCDAMLQRIDSYEFRVHVCHHVGDIQNAARLEKIDGIPRAAVLVRHSFTKEDIVESTHRAIDAMKMRQDDRYNRKRRRFSFK